MMEYEVITGYVTQINNQERIRAVSIVYRKVPRTLTLKKRGLTKLELLTTIQYSESISKDEYAVQKDEVEKMAVEAMKKALQEAQHNEHSNTGFGGSDTGYYKFRQQHIKVWNKLWETGFYISKSKADNALNGSSPLKKFT